MHVNSTSTILLPNNIDGRSIHSNIIPTVSNLKNMITKLKEVNGDRDQLKPWDKRSYDAYRIDDIKPYLLEGTVQENIHLLKKHILRSNIKDLGPNCIDMYLVAYVAETHGPGKDELINYVFNHDISDKTNSAQAIWQVGRGDGVFLGILNNDGSIADWNFFASWIKGQ
ncbi:hypothetical protein GLW08_10890 [Pontibacillus yanchengensis]|uniref:Uncharacterized protein n=1 Tax=Pontibacillus yanchengensis TaxID=462910 RepID=A0ACC7VFZ0_9BACI|nr:hypothetical protein [Pontibacillus yanchengensis]MYL53841.1 hypothetical protein [Pontibacillus yanchengensis]